MRNILYPLTLILLVIALSLAMRVYTPLAQSEQANLATAIE